MNLGPLESVRFNKNGRQEPNSTTQKTVQVQKLCLIRSGDQTKWSVGIAKKSSRSRQKGRFKVQEGNGFKFHL